MANDLLSNAAAVASAVLWISLGSVPPFTDDIVEKGFKGIQ